MSDRILSRDDILNANDLKTEPVAVPEWGGTVLVKMMSGTERDEFESSISVGRGKNRDVNLRNFRAKLVARCLVDEEGRLLFGEGDIAALGRKSAAALQRVVDVAVAVNALSQEDVDELTKNSESDPSDGSTSD